MKRIRKIPTILIAILLVFPSLSYSAWIWTPETNAWLNPKHVVKDTSNEQLKHALNYYEAKDYKRAISEFDKLIKFYPESKHAPKAQYYIGRSYEDMSEYYHAYLAYQKVIEAYPYAKNREEIIKKQYEIGVRFLRGEKAKVLGVALLPATDKAIEIFEQVAKNSPYGPEADAAQFKIGESYKKSGSFAEATMAFQRVVDEYPKSELVNDANYEIAKCAYVASLGPSYDQETTDTAIEKFEEFVDASGSEELSKEAIENIKILNEKKAKGLFETARFYEKTGHLSSAALYYKELADNYPNSSLAKESIARIMEIERAVR